jgi:lipoyl(octanoyl) transferase
LTAIAAPAYLYRLPGLTSYAAGLALQQELAAARSQHALPDTIVLLEHEPVVTLGPRTDAAADLPDRDALAARGIEVAETDRGGRATYHGPGQLVAYPIVDLTRLGRDLRAYVASLQQAVVETLAAVGVEGAPREGRDFVGVWVEERKIASIGVQVSGWVASHGLALNVTRASAEPFGLFTPCGLPGLEVTSVEQETGREPDLDALAGTLAERLADALGVVLEPVPTGAPA